MAFLSHFRVPLWHPAERRGFYFVKTSDTEDRNHFLFFKVVTIFPPRRRPTTLVSARGPTAGTPSGNLSSLTRLRPIFVLAFLSHFRVPLWRLAERSQVIVCFGSFRLSRRQGISKSNHIP